MGMAMAGDAVSAQHADIMLKVGFALQKKTMDLAELQGQMLQELMASMGVGKNLDIQA